MMPFTFQGGPRLTEIGLVTSASPTGPCSDFTSSLDPACEIEKVELWQGRVSGTQRYVPLRFGIVGSTAATGAATITAPIVTGTSNSMGLVIFSSALSSAIPARRCAKRTALAYEPARC